MDIQENFFQRLKEILNRFDSTFKVETLKSCGQCYYCCTPVTKYPWLYPLEKDFIDKHTGHAIPSSKDFEDFLLNTSLPVCPFYKIGSGCGIYHVRPLFCRIFGPVDTDRPVPHFCIYCDLPGRIPYPELKEFIYEYRCLNLDYTEYRLSLTSDQEKKFFLLMELGTEYMLLYKFSEGFNIFKKALELYDSDFSVYYNLGWACLEMKDFRRGADYFLKSLELGAAEKRYRHIYEKLASLYIYEKLGCAFFCLNMIDRAEEFYIKALKVNRRNIVCHTGLLTIYHMTGRKEEFHRKLKRLLTKFPEDETVQKFASLGI